LPAFVAYFYMKASFVKRKHYKRARWAIRDSGARRGRDLAKQCAARRRVNSSAIREEVGGAVRQARRVIRGCLNSNRPSRLLAVYTLLSILQVIIAVIVIFLVLLHSGKDAGLSGAFGIGGGGSSFGGGSMVERNLDRATIFFSILFVVNTIVLLKLG
jgi:preprotein translocase subunit SecG